jgi:hypothetical protein
MLLFALALFYIDESRTFSRPAADMYSNQALRIDVTGERGDCKDGMEVT